MIHFAVDTISFGDSGQAISEVIFVLGHDAQVPERFPSKAIHRRRHDLLRFALKSPIEIPLMVASFPGILAMAVWDAPKGNHRCMAQGKEMSIPAHSTVAVAIASNHRVEYKSGN
jgi:hypothetical protein